MAEVLLHLIGYVVGELILFNLGRLMLSVFTLGCARAESRDDMEHDLAEGDCIQWQPRFGFFQRFTWSGGHNGIRGDFLGYIYAPLILLDQSHIHPTIPLWRTPGDPDSGIDPNRIPPITEWHPARVNPFAGRFPYTSSMPKPK